jgi:branched-chain amino acid transport system permease protein
MSAVPLAVSLHALGSGDFWIGVGVLAAIYGVFTLGLQLNIGYSGVVNFGQAGFMAIGAYAMAILVVKAHWSMWAAMGAAVAIAMVAGMLIGLPSLRLRADYFAIATIAFSEIVRYVAQNAGGLTGGNQGLLGYDGAWVDASNHVLDWVRPLGLDSQFQLPLLIVAWAVFLVATVALAVVQRTPWGRVLRAVREDEDVARALGKNAYAYKLQSIAIAAALGATAGCLLALELAFLNPTSFEPLYTFLGFTILVLGGLASYAGVVLGSLILWTLLEGTRFLDLPLAAEKVAAVRLMLVGLALILLVALRPQGILGNRQEMVLGD